MALFKRAEKVVAHIAPTARVRRDNEYVPGFAFVNERGLPIHPHMSRPELEEAIKNRNLDPVYYKTYAEARKAVLGDKA